VAVHEATGTLIAAVSDGVSAAPRSGLGAALAVRYATAAVARHLDAGTIDWTNVFEQAAWALRSARSPELSVRGRTLYGELTCRALGSPARRKCASSHADGFPESRSWGPAAVPGRDSRPGPPTGPTVIVYAVARIRVNSVAPAYAAPASPTIALLGGSDAIW
jgi:hypothetical protein